MHNEDARQIERCRDDCVQMGMMVNGFAQQRRWMQMGSIRAKEVLQRWMIVVVREVDEQR